MKVAKKAHDGVSERLNFHCPGCDEVHSVTLNPGWTWNGSLEKPTLSPSILVTSGHYIPGYDKATCYCNTKDPDGDEWPWKCGRCHSFVTDGRIQFLSDCTHALAGQTVDLLPWPNDAE